MYSLCYTNQYKPSLMDDLWFTVTGPEVKFHFRTNAVWNGKGFYLHYSGNQIRSLNYSLRFFVIIVYFDSDVTNYIIFYSLICTLKLPSVVVHCHWKQERKMIIILYISKYTVLSEEQFESMLSLKYDNLNSKENLKFTHIILFQAAVIMKYTVTVSLEILGRLKFTLKQDDL